MSASDIVGSLALAASTLSVLLLALQIRQSDRFKAAEFINNLEDYLANQHDTYEFLIEFSQGDSKRDNIEIGELMIYIGFFEKILMISDKKLLDMRSIDRLFAYRFFLTCNNLYSQEKVLLNSGYDGFFTSIFVLHKKWKNYRIANGFDIPLKETDLETSNPDFYVKQIETHMRAFK